MDYEIVIILVKYLQFEILFSIWFHILTPHDGLSYPSNVVKWLKSYTFLKTWPYYSITPIQLIFALDKVEYSNYQQWYPQYKAFICVRSMRGDCIICPLILNGLLHSMRNNKQMLHLNKMAGTGLSEHSNEAKPVNSVSLQKVLSGKDYPKALCCQIYQCGTREITTVCIH